MKSRIMALAVVAAALAVDRQPGFVLLAQALTFDAASVKRNSSELLQPSTAPGTDAGGGVFTALQEQLGLKLEPIQAPLEFVVIDSIEAPTEN